MAEKRVAIVTAASRGMGAAIARDLAENYYHVALMSTSGAAEELAHELAGIAVTGSVADPAALEQLVNTAFNTYGRIDAVVNNTGHPPKGELLAIPDEDWHAGMELVMLNVVRMARLVTPLMRAQGGGAIVNISTFAAFEPTRVFPVSASFRAALASFTKIYADEYAPARIRMNNVLPGFVNSLPEKEDFLAQIPMGRYGTVEEIAATVRFLLSDAAAYITGQNIRVDGGITRSV